MRILVTGSSGFIARHLIGYLLSSGHEVGGIDKIAEIENNFWFKSVDIRDPDQIQIAIKSFNPDCIVHLAAQTDLVKNPTPDYYSTNTVGTQNLINAISRSNNVQKCVVASSQLVCKLGYKPVSDCDYCPDTRYGESKVQTEKISRQSDWGSTSWCIIRPTTIWGPGMNRHYQNFFKYLMKGKYFHISNSALLKSYGFVKNSAYQLAKLCECPSSLTERQMFYLADYKPLSLRDWINQLNLRIGTKKLRTLPKPIATMLAKGGDMFELLSGKGCPFNTRRLNNILTEYTFDTSKLYQICGNTPIAYEEALDLTAEWILSLKFD